MFYRSGVTRTREQEIKYFCFIFKSERKILLVVLITDARWNFFEPSSSRSKRPYSVMLDLNETRALIRLFRGGSCNWTRMFLRQIWTEWGLYCMESSESDLAREDWSRALGFPSTCMRFPDHEQSRICLVINKIVELSHALIQVSWTALSFTDLSKTLCLLWPYIRKFQHKVL